MRRELAAALDVDRVRAVDHDLGDGVVAQERLERAVAEDVVRDLAGDLRALLARQRRLVERDRLFDGLAHALGSSSRRRLVVAGGEEARAEARDDVMVDARLELGERVGDAGLLGLVALDAGRAGRLRVARCVVGSVRGLEALTGGTWSRRLPQLQAEASPLSSSAVGSSGAAGARRPSLAARAREQLARRARDSAFETPRARRRHRDRDAAVDGDADLAVAGDVAADLHVERALDVARACSSARGVRRG